jgi:hypothetical protein
MIRSLAVLCQSLRAAPTPAVVALCLAPIVLTSSMLLFADKLGVRSSPTHLSKLRTHIDLDPYGACVPACANFTA